MIDQEIDILIIGGGLVGASLLLALQKLGLKILLIEAHSFADKKTPDFDARSLALAQASQRILDSLGLWEGLKNKAQPINTIHVSEQNRFGNSCLQGEKNAPLGYVLEMHDINQAINELIPAKQILAPAHLVSLDKAKQEAKINTGPQEITIKFKLLVAADGTDSTVRKLCGIDAKIKSYQQQAIVTNIGLTKPHGGWAYERFTSQGPLALLPLSQNKMSLVWSMPPEKAEQILQLKETDFLLALQKAFGYKLGRFIKSGRPYSYPLKQVLTMEQASWPLIFLGNAAHTLHPVAGQGFNLSLRDAAALAQSIALYKLNPEMLKHYVSLRVKDQGLITGLTDGLIHLFNTKLPGAGLARGLGLLALDNSKTLKKLLARYAQGYGAIVPDLVCGLTLDGQELK